MIYSHTLIPLITIVRKEVVRFLRIWPQTLLPPVVTQSLYFLIFGTFIGSRVGDVGGVPYMAFIVPGLVMMASIINSFSNVISSFFGAKFQRNIEEIMVSPTPNWVIVLGFSIGGMLRGMLAAGLVFAVSVFFTRPVITSPVLILIFITLSSLLFALAGLLNSMFARRFDDITIFTTFILTPLTYLGGVFYSIEQLPPFWRTVSLFNPIVYMVDGFRAGFYGVSEFPLYISLTLILSLTVGLFCINWWMLNQGYGLKK